MRTLRAPRLLVAAVAATALSTVATAGGASASPAAHAPPATRAMVVFLHPLATATSVTSDGARARSEDSSLLAGAGVTGAAVVARTTVPDTVTVWLTASQARAVASSPLVAHVLADVSIPGPSPPSADGPAPAPGAASRAAVAHASCGTARHPQLNPEALSNVDAPGAWAAGATGKGVTVAFLADGIDPTNVDLRRNPRYASAGSPAGSRVITTYQDFSGDGTTRATDGAEAFGDASSIAAQGNKVYDLSRIVSRAHRLPAGCDVRIVGVAPGATLLALKIFSKANMTTGSGFVQAIDYAVASGAKVINESFGGNPFPDTATDIIRAANEAAVAAGVTVVASSGDAGVSGTIGSPATDGGVIAVGASTTFRAYTQETFGGINAPGADGRYLDNNISSLSSGGFAQDGKTVNLVAPGDLGWALCSSNAAKYSECSGKALQDFGGTSQSSPLTAGAAADVIEAYRLTHHGADPAPALVESILTSTAKDIDAPADQQGSGLLDVAAAVAMARSVAGTTARPVGGLLESTPQVDLEGLPGTHATRTITLTNTSHARSVVALSTRALVPAGAAAGAVTLDPSRRTRQPKFSIWSGALEVYRKATFRVRPGIDRVKLTAAFRFTGQTSPLHFALFDPHGALAGYSEPQGIGDFGDVEVARPAPGTWTAVFFTVWDGYGAHNTGTSGRVPYSATFWRYRPDGVVTPHALSLAPGQTQSFGLHVAFPAAPGDSSLSIAVRSGSSATSIPVTVRTDVAITAHGGAYRGVLTGGNGRDGAPGETDTYSFAVPAGKRDLDASLAMSKNPGAGILPGDQVIGMLVDPAGQLAAYDSNYTTGPGFQPTVSRYLNLYKADPAAGQWSLVLDWAQPGAGARTSIPFAGAIRFDQVDEQTTLPDAASSTISAAAGATYQLKVTNTGVAPMILSPDARLTTTAAFPLFDVAGAPTIQPFGSAANTFYVPTETSSLTVSVAASVPPTFDTSSAPGDPDLSPTLVSPYVVGSLSPTTATATYAPPTEVSPGLWNVVPAEIGPFGAAAEPAGTETTSATATALAFDPTVTTSVPDTVEALTLNAGTISPDFVAPGDYDLISIHVAPTAKPGTVVTGTLFVDGLTTGATFGETIVDEPIFTSDLAAIPYEYTAAP